MIHSFGGEEWQYGLPTFWFEKELNIWVTHMAIGGNWGLTCSKLKPWKTQWRYVCHCDTASLAMDCWSGQYTITYWPWLPISTDSLFLYFFASPLSSLTNYYTSWTYDIYPQFFQEACNFWKFFFQPFRKPYKVCQLVHNIH